MHSYNLILKINIFVNSYQILLKVFIIFTEYFKIVSQVGQGRKTKHKNNFLPMLKLLDYENKV